MTAREIVRSTLGLDRPERDVDLDAEHADEHAEKRSSAFWYAMWTEARRRNAEIVLELAKERIKLDRLGSASDTAVGVLDRQRERIAALEAELAKERERTAGMLGAEARP